MSILVCVNASGISIPSFYIFRGKRIRQNFVEKCEGGAAMAVQEKAWMTSYLFSTWMSHFIKNVQRLEDISPDHQHLLILDGHNSHVTLEVVREAKAVGLDLVTLPSHTSHALQPLDVSVFKPFKTYFQLYRDYWSRHNLAATPSKQTLAQWSSLALRKALSSANIKAGFRATGIWPMDREAIQRHLQPSTIFREPCHDHDPAPGSQEQALESENEDTLHDQNVQVEASEQQEGGGEQSLESTEIAMHLAEEPIPTTEHFFVDVNHADPDVPDEMGSIDPDVEAVQSSTRFLTLPSLTRRVNRNPRDPMIDFTKSIMLTSDEYVTAVEAARQAKINATKEKERLREEKEQRKKKKAADREEEKKERQARALIIAEARALQAREREETRANRQEACAMHSREELVLVLESDATARRRELCILGWARTLLNTDLKKELHHMATFLHSAAAYKKKLGFQGNLLLEPKPQEPTKHQCVPFPGVEQKVL